MELEKCVILLPLTHSDGKPVPAKVILGIFEELWMEFRGFHVAGTGWGPYEMGNGQMQVDNCLQVWVGVPTAEESGSGRLKEMCKVWAGTLKQESIYFERTGAKIEFIPSSSGGGLFK